MSNDQSNGQLISKGQKRYTSFQSLVDEVTPKIQRINDVHGKLEQMEKSFEKVKSANDHVDALHKFCTPTNDNEENFSYYKKSLKEKNAEISTLKEEILSLKSEAEESKRAFNDLNDNTQKKYDGLNGSLDALKPEIQEFVLTYKKQLEEEKKSVELIKQDLQEYRDQVVGGSLFRTFKTRADKMDLSSSSYGKGSILCLVTAAIILFVTLFTGGETLTKASISVILGVSSFVCARNSKIFRKLAEEYAHKGTLLESFVGYREQYKETLDDEEYSQFFAQVIEAIKVNPSDKVDRLLYLKEPLEKGIEAVSDLGKKAIESIPSKQ